MLASMPPRFLDDHGVAHLRHPAHAGEWLTTYASYCDGELMLDASMETLEPPTCLWCAARAVRS